MTRFIHDQFAKQYLTELLTPYGQVETSKDITAEVRQIDVLFIPSPQPTQSRDLFFGRRLKNHHYCNSPTPQHTRNPISQDIRKGESSTTSSIDL